MKELYKHDMALQQPFYATDCQVWNLFTTRYHGKRPWQTKRFRQTINRMLRMAGCYDAVR